uniref:RRM domain-containing protein n=1 Tax=Clastoptera arizonana TaxID=38151 RepID=A0A1B6CWU4_9HEMI
MANKLVNTSIEELEVEKNKILQSIPIRPKRKSNTFFITQNDSEKGLNEENLKNRNHTLKAVPDLPVKKMKTSHSDNVKVTDTSSVTINDVSKKKKKLKVLQQQEEDEFKKNTKKANGQVETPKQIDNNPLNGNFNKFKPIEIDDDDESGDDDDDDEEEDNANAGDKASKHKPTEKISGRSFIDFEAEEGEETSESSDNEKKIDFSHSDINNKNTFNKKSEGSKQNSNFRIVIRKLPEDVTEDLILEAFNVFGEIKNISIIMDRETNKPRGFAFVDMEDRDALERAVEVSDVLRVGDTRVQISEYKDFPEGNRGGRGGFRGRGRGFGGRGDGNFRGRGDGGFRGQGGFRGRGEGNRGRGNYRGSSDGFRGRGQNFKGGRDGNFRGRRGGFGSSRGKNQD